MSYIKLPTLVEINIILATKITSIICAVTIHIYNLFYYSHINFLNIDQVICQFYLSIKFICSFPVFY